MNLFSELVQAVQDDLSVDDNSTLYSPALIKRTINRAYIKCAGLFNWPETEDALKTKTVAGQEYYDYPREFRSDTIGRLEVDDEQWGESPDGSPMAWSDYLVWRNDSDNTNSTEKKWANQRRRYFIYPVPTEANLDICVWGQVIPDALSSDGDITIWSYSMPEGNEAIILETVAMLKSKGNSEKAGEFRSTEAKQLLIVAWGKLVKEQAKYEKDQPLFEVPDYYGSNSQNVKNNIGKF